MGYIQERFHCLNTIFIKGSNIVIFIYELQEKVIGLIYINEFLGNKNSVYGIVGNKMDLFD